MRLPTVLIGFLLITSLPIYTSQSRLSIKNPLDCSSDSNDDIISISYIRGSENEIQAYDRLRCKNTQEDFVALATRSGKLAYIQTHKAELAIIPQSPKRNSFFSWLCCKASVAHVYDPVNIKK